MRLQQGRTAVRPGKRDGLYLTAFRGRTIDFQFCPFTALCGKSEPNVSTGERLGAISNASILNKMNQGFENYRTENNLDMARERTLYT
jgi:hypothetical protein